MVKTETLLNKLYMRHVLTTKRISKVIGLICVVLFLSEAVPMMGKTVRLNVHTRSFPDGTVIELHKVAGSTVAGSQLDLIQSFPLEIGHIESSFVAEVDVTEPTLYVLQAKTKGAKPSQLKIMVDPSDTQINLTIWYDEVLNYIELRHTSGSKNMELMKGFNSTIYASLPVLHILNDEYSKVKGNGVIQSDKKQAIENAYIVLSSRTNRKIKQLISENTDCLMAAYLMSYFEDKNKAVLYVDLYEKVLKGLASTYSSNIFVDRLRTTITAINGEKAPEIAMPDKDGRIRKLSSLRGKVVLIDFCSSWCVHCWKEIPEIVRLYRKYRNKGFDIYSVSLDNDREKWLNYIKENGQEWENHVSELKKWDCSAAKAYDVHETPYYVLVDRKGRIISTITNNRIENLTVILEEIFDE